MNRVHEYYQYGSSLKQPVHSDTGIVLTAEHKHFCRQGRFTGYRSEDAKLLHSWLFLLLYNRGRAQAPCRGLGRPMKSYNRLPRGLLTCGHNTTIMKRIHVTRNTMGKANDIGPIEKVANLCYRWHTQNTVDEAGLMAVSELFGSPLNTQQIQHVAARIRRDKGFDKTQSEISARWEHRFNHTSRLGEKAAQAYLQELFVSFDHTILFHHDVSANSTAIERGKVSDSRTYYAGTMPCWTLHLTTAGRALYLNDNIELEAGPGDLLLFHPEAKFHCGLHPGARYWQHHWALFKPQQHWRDLLEWRSLDTGIYHAARTDAKTRAKIQRVFEELIELSSERSPIQEDLQYNRLEELLIRARGLSSPPDDAVDRRIQKACDYMRRNITAGFHLDEVAADCNLSTSRLAHLFRERMGISPKCWSNNMRLQQARKLLLANNDGINVVARRVGYDDPSQFSRYFKKNIGCSPREFRQLFGGHASQKTARRLGQCRGRERQLLTSTAKK